MFRLQLLLLLRGGENADADGFGEVEGAARLGGVVLLQVHIIDDAGDGEAEDRFRRVDGVTTGQRDTRLFTGGATAVDHLARHFRSQLVDGPAEDRDGHHRRTAHGVDIADRIGGGDAAELERVVDDGHEKVGRADHRAAVAQVVGRRVVARLVAHQQARVGAHGEAAVKDLLQQLGRDLAAAAGTVAVFGHADGLF